MEHGCEVLLPVLGYVLLLDIPNKVPRALNEE